jgi:hypothetical protein
MIVFVFLFVGLIIVSVYTLAFAAHSFLHIVSCTAAGVDEVMWADEPMVDWLHKGVTMGWLVAVCVAPAGIIGRAAGMNIGTDPLPPLILTAGILWLFLPIGVLSSLTGSTRWAFFRPRVVAAMLRMAGTTLGFYLVTALLFAIALPLWYYAIVRQIGLVPIAAVVGGAVLMIYARLIGRLGSGLLNLNPKRRVDKSASSPARMVFGSIEDHARPAEEPPPEETTLEDRDEADDEKVEEKAAPAPEDDEDEFPAVPGMRSPYEINKEDRPPPVKAAPPKLNRARKIERKLSRLRRPTRPLLDGVFTFPVYDVSQRTLAWLTFSGSAVGAVFNFVLALWPF